MVEVAGGCGCRCGVEWMRGYNEERPFGVSRFLKQHLAAQYAY